MRLKSASLVAFLLAIGGLLHWGADGARGQETDPPKDYRPQTVSEEDLARWRDEFLAYVNPRRKVGRADKAADREKTPEDLKFNEILNKAAQYHADRMAIHENETGVESSSHSGDDLDSPPHMNTPSQRMRHFGWPKDDMNYPPSGAEANAGPAKGADKITGALFAKGWMDSSTHYRPFFCYKDKKLGDHDFNIVGFGISKTKTGGYYACAIFGVSPKPVVKLTADQLKALPQQILDGINASRGGMERLTLHPELTKSAKALADGMAENKRDLNEDEIAKTMYPGGWAYGTRRGVQFNSAKSIVDSFYDTKNPNGLAAPRMRNIGIALALDDDGSPYIAIYWGHP